MIGDQLEPKDVLKLLGSQRSIWIDDHFSKESVANIAGLLIEHPEIAKQAEFGALNIQGLQETIQAVDDGDVQAEGNLRQLIADLEVGQRSDIHRAMIQADAKTDGNTQDLNPEQIECVCRQLEIRDEDRWPFDGAEVKIKELCQNGDADITYIIDLNDAGEKRFAANQRGVDLLRLLRKQNTKGTVFVLTHEARPESESTLEEEFEAELAKQDVIDEAGESIKANAEKEVGATNEVVIDCKAKKKIGYPFLVIAKSRLEPNFGEELESTVANGLRIALKRAGLRRSVSEVLVTAKDEIHSAFDSAMRALLSVPPEQLDKYVVGRAYAEGVSEMHVIERALTASISESLRILFAQNATALKGAQCMRALRAIDLKNSVGAPDLLEPFRRMEVFEPAELVNGSYSGIACGDVFEFVQHSDAEKVVSAKKFILLAQPCDVVIRSKGKRLNDTGFFVQLDEVPAGTPPKGGLKALLLPFVLNKSQWQCNLNTVASVKLDVLDLASSRLDGRVIFQDEPLPLALLPGQAKSANRLRGKLIKALVAFRARKDQRQALFRPECQLALSASGAFKEIAHATYVAGTVAEDGKPALAEHLTWQLRRWGRVRMPYAASLLNSFFAVQGRDAFDLDYLKPEEICEVPEEGEPAAAAPAPG